MPLILRAVKGSKLTISEMDGNLVYLSSTLSGSVIQVTGSSINASNTPITSSFFVGDGSKLTNVTSSFITASNVYGPYGANSVISASYAATSSITLQSISSSYALTASYVSEDHIGLFTGSFTGIISGSNIIGDSQYLPKWSGNSPGMSYAFETSSIFQNNDGTILIVKSTTISGSFVQGQSTNIASGQFSHAEGSSSIASGISSHAEGYKNISSGEFSHAEGYGSIASNLGSHAEGIFTTASGQFTHTEGSQTQASGYASHAGGVLSSAVGSGANAEGYKTIASGDYQTVVGIRNISNTSSMFIVGGGSDLGGATQNAFSVEREVTGTGVNICSIVIPTNITDPGNPLTGSMYYDTSTDKMWVWNGVWRSASFGI